MSTATALEAYAASPKIHPLDGTKSIGKSRKPAAILDACIKDIEAGRWICNELTETCPVEEHSKAMGCGLGLVGINAGLATYNVFGNPAFIYASLTYPVEGGWSKNALKVVELLAATDKLPKRFKERVQQTAEDGYDAPLDEIARNSSAVVTYNDQGKGATNNGNGSNLTKTQALNWFKRARALAGGS